MGRFLRYVFFIHLIVCLSTLIACTGIHLPDSPSWEAVQLTDISRVAGKWEGVTWAEPRTIGQDDWVEVRITEDGQFKFASYRMMGAWLGSGTLRLENGNLVTEPQPNRGSATFTLYESHGKSMLKVNGRTKTGDRQVAELTPVKK